MTTEESKPVIAQITTPVAVPKGLEVATFAAGCFWCTEAVFQEQNGIEDVISGYVGGQEPNPTYKQVYTNNTGHREGVQFFYDPTVLSYEEILDLLWVAIDPTDDGGQFVDRGFSYTTAIFYHNDTQRQLAQKSISNLEASEIFNRSVVTDVLPFTTFYKAEEYHQDYYKKAPSQYKNYAENSGRTEYKEAVWQDILSQQEQN